MVPIVGDELVRPKEVSMKESVGFDINEMQGCIEALVDIEAPIFPIRFERGNVGLGALT